MTRSIIWLHDEALRTSHPVFSAAPAGTKAFFIWDDAYLRQSAYTLKRLVFLYETLCDLPVDILLGDTLATLQGFSVEELYVPRSHNPFVQNVAAALSGNMTVRVVQDEPFICMGEHANFKRFFQYWKKAEKSAFSINGGGISDVPGKICVR